MPARRFAAVSPWFPVISTEPIRNCGPRRTSKTTVNDPSLALREYSTFASLYPCDRRKFSILLCESSSRSSSTDPSRRTGTRSASRDGGNGSPVKASVTSGPRFTATVTPAVSPLAS
jgi:hypothetical protein